MSTSKAKGRKASTRKTSSRKASTTSRKKASRKAPAKPAASSAPVDLAERRKAKKAAEASAVPAVKPETPAPAADTAPPVIPDAPKVEAPPAPDAPPAPKLKAGQVIVDADDLRALLAIAPKAEARYYLNAVHIARADTGLRYTVSDGHRLLVLSRECKGKLAWAEGDGALLPRENLERVLRYCGSKWEAPLLLSFEGKNAEAVIETDGATFRFRQVDGRFPNVGPIIAKAAGCLASDREPGDSTLLDSKYMQGAGRVAGLLGGGGVHCYPASEGTEVSLFTFEKAPHAMMLIAPLRGTNPGVSANVAGLMGAQALAGTLSALRAHKTRADKAAKAAKDAGERKALEARAEAFAGRIAAIVEGTAKQLEHKPAKATRKKKAAAK